VEGKVCNLSVRLANSLPLSIYPNLASHGARGVFDQSNVMTACHGHEGGEVAGHPHLVDRENGAGAIGYGRGNLLGIDIVGPRINIDETRSCATISDAVGGCDE
jgi:hypothetical protein